jgi:hypothetical protein
MREDVTNDRPSPSNNCLVTEERTPRSGRLAPTPEVGAEQPLQFELPFHRNPYCTAVANRSNPLQLAKPTEQC